eukprot:scaffold876_cov243-Pinguiococcus_pyrenoidosus.AAC.49
MGDPLGPAFLGIARAPPLRIFPPQRGRSLAALMDLANRSHELGLNGILTFAFARGVHLLSSAPPRLLRKSDTGEDVELCFDSVSAKRGVT